MDIAPIIVMDGRHVTPALVYELNELIERQLKYKLFIFIGDKGQRALLDHFQLYGTASLLRGTALVREAGLLTFLQYMTKVWQELPTPERPLDRIIQERGCEIVTRHDWQYRPPKWQD